MLQRVRIEPVQPDTESELQPIPEKPAKVLSVEFGRRRDGHITLSGMGDTGDTLDALLHQVEYVRLEVAGRVYYRTVGNGNIILGGAFRYEFLPCGVED